MSKALGYSKPTSSLLDRLVRGDDEAVDSRRVSIDPSTQGRPNRRAHLRQMSELNRNISQDLVSLLATRRMSVDHDLSAWPEVQRSVLNYGVSDLTGTTASGVRMNRIERELKNAISRFEPRLHSNSLTVRCTFDTAERNQLLVSVEANFGPASAPEAFAMGVSICLVSGQCNWVNQAQAA